MSIPTGYVRRLAVVYRGRDVEVRLQGVESTDFTTALGEITRTYTSFLKRGLVSAEKSGKEGFTRCFSFLVSDYPEDPPATTTRLVFEGLMYEIKSHSRSSDGTFFDIDTYRV